jgi:short-subunit dehydrogenase
MWPRTSQRTNVDRASLVLITGASNGIGRATAFLLGQRGFSLGLIDRDEARLSEVARELSSKGVTVHAEAADVRDAAELRDAIRRIEAPLGATQVVVACAGVGTLSNSLDLDVEGFRKMLEVNVLGVAHTIEAVLPGMFAQGSGHIVGIASVAAYRGLPWMPGYSASKAAIATYLEGLRPAVKLRGVLVSTVYPGFVRTAMTADTPFRKPMPMMEPELAARHIARVVLRKPRDYCFPLSARLGMGLLRRLPNRLFDHCMTTAGPKALTTEF